MDFEARASIALFGYDVSSESKHERNALKNITKALREAYEQGRRDERELILNKCRGMGSWNGYVPNDTDLAEWILRQLGNAPRTPVSSPTDSKP